MTEPVSYEEREDRAELETLYIVPAASPDLEQRVPETHLEQVTEHPTQSLGISTYMRPPESEIYGRSLSTLRRLGAYMMEVASLAEGIESPEAAQAKVEFYTSVEEGFGTDMELGGGLEVRDFDSRPVIDGKVMSKDLQTSVSTMTEAGLACALETVQKDERFAPQLTRSEWDHENALIVDAMAQGKTDYNTRIVISPFPEEAAAQSGDAYWRNIGYVPHLRRGFVQLYHVSDGEVITGSLSFDGSSKQQLRAVFAQFGVTIPEGEITDNWLKYAITSNLSEQDAKLTATVIANKAADSTYQKNTNTVDVTAQYRPVMERTFNESYVHVCESLSRGYQTDGARELIRQLADNAHHFNGRYAQTLYNMCANTAQFTDDDAVALHELLVYATIEMMRALHLRQTEAYGDFTTVPHDTAAYYLQSADPALFQSMLSGFGAEGARNNRTYSACGLSISLGDGNQNSPQSAFGGQDKSGVGDTDKLGSRWFACPKGHLNYRTIPNVPESHCKKCHADVSCQPPKPVRPKSRKQSTNRTRYAQYSSEQTRTRTKSRRNIGQMVLDGPV